MVILSSELAAGPTHGEDHRYDQSYAIKERSHPVGASADGKLEALNTEREGVDRKQGAPDVRSRLDLRRAEKDGGEVRRLYVGLTRLSTARLGELHCFEETAMAKE